jgi:dTDP-glucose 4,6-dehydratase
MTNVPETYLGGPDPMLANSAYGEGKRVAELLSALASTNGLEVKIARVFALVGPHLPLDQHFAIGNFLGAAMAGEQIVIKGDGKPYRSYLYAADMVAWLWAVLIKGHPGRAYNVGSEEILSIHSLAEKISSVFERTLPIAVQQAASPNAVASYYAPNTERVRQDLQLPAPIALDEAISRTRHWHTSVTPKFS